MRKSPPAALPPAAPGPQEKAPPRGKRRVEAKEVTRAKVLDAAETLFARLGWEATTLRDVAASADVSTGAIFSSFADKAALFHAVLERDQALLMEKMSACAEQELPIEDALVEMFMCGYRHYDGKLPFLRALQHVMWAEDGRAIRELLAAVPLAPLFASRLQIAVVWKELRDERLTARSRMLLDCYLANYPHALYGAWNLATLRKRAKVQIEVILAGARP